MSPVDTTVDAEKERRKIKSVKRMKDIMTHYYIEAKTAEPTRARKVAWITSGGPVEPLIAHGHHPGVPGKPRGHDRCRPRWACGSLRNRPKTMGYSQRPLFVRPGRRGLFHQWTAGPSAGCPSRTCWSAATTSAARCMKWYEVQARYYEVRRSSSWTRPSATPEFSEEARQYVKRQFEELNWSFWPNTLRQSKPTIDRLKELVGRLLHAQGTGLWQAVLDTTVHKSRAHKLPSTPSSTWP